MSVVKSVSIIGNGATAMHLDGRLFVNRHTANFATSLANEGLAITFIEPRVPLIPNGNLQDGELPKAKVRSVHLDKSIEGLCRTAKALHQSDLVYIFYPGTVARYVARYCRFLGLPYAIYLRGEQFGSSCDVANLRGARFLCCVGGMDDKVRHLNSRVIPIRPMLDLTPLDAKRRDFLDRDDSPWRLLFVGRLEAAKGVPELIDAAYLLHATGVRFELTLVGGGELYPDLAARFGGKEDGFIRVTGVIDNKAELHARYESADIFVLPTHHEGFPRVLYEAMIKSNAIITTAVGGIPSILNDGVDALFCPVADPEAIVKILTSLVNDRVRMQSLSDNAQAKFHLLYRSRPDHSSAFLSEIQCA